MLNDDNASAPDTASTAAREQMSALVDGELSGQTAATVCADWRQRDEARATWHAYHLIGDVLRSEDLCRDAGHDAQFVADLRIRLAREPVVLAPTPLEPIPIPISNPNSIHTNANDATARSVPPKRRGWMAPSAVAAGFAAVALVTLLPGSPNNGSLPPPSPSRPKPILADAPLTTNLGAASNAPPPALIANRDTRDTRSSGEAGIPSPAVTGTVIRNAGLDRYLSEHRQFSGSSALGMPSAFFRDATTDVAR